MTGFFKKLFGAGTSEESNTEHPAAELTKDLLDELIEVSGFKLQYDVDIDGNNEILVELTGADEDILTAKEGQLLDAIQLFVKRSLQHQLTEHRCTVSIDTNGFREEANQGLIDLAEKLKGIAVSKGKPVYFRALPPRDRKIIHQYLAEDGLVKSRSIGDGLYKKIKIFPVKERGNEVKSASSNMQ